MHCTFSFCRICWTRVSLVGLPWYRSSKVKGCISVVLWGSWGLNTEANCGMGLARMIWESCSSCVEEERREKGGRKEGERGERKERREEGGREKKGGREEEGGKRREGKGRRDNIPILAMDKLQYAVPMTWKCVHVHSCTSSWSLLGSSSLRLFSARAGDSGQVAGRGLFSGTPYVNSHNRKPGSTFLVLRAGNYCGSMWYFHCPPTLWDSWG